jgi:hypothetical protein
VAATSAAGVEVAVVACDVVAAGVDVGAAVGAALSPEIKNF